MDQTRVVLRIPDNCSEHIMDMVLFISNEQKFREPRYSFLAGDAVCKSEKY